MTIVSVPWGAPADVPVDPDSGQAREWLIAELSKPEYQAAKPTLFDRISQAVLDWLNSLGGSGAPGGLGFGPILLIALVVLAALIVAAYFVFGPPRVNRRSARGVLFGTDDERDAATMRRAAAEAAARGDFTLAIEELFRATARDLSERTLVVVNPGTTAGDFAVRAGEVFPAFDPELRAAAALFDGVRYLGETGAEPGYRRIEQLERGLRAARPTLAVPVVSGSIR